MNFRLCYKRRMRDLRDWISEKMRRRPRRGPNDSESTGKSGEELPANQLAPLRPSYPDSPPVQASQPEPQPLAETETPAFDEPAGPFAPAQQEQRLVVETQPDSVAVAPAEQPALKSPKG